MALLSRPAMPRHEPHFPRRNVLETMNAIKDIITRGLLVTLVINLAYWHGRRTERYVYFPASEWCRTMFLACGSAAGVAALLWLLMLVPLEVAGFSGMFYLTALQGYSIWFRWHQRHVLA